MARHECITYSRQERFDVEADLRCGVLDFEATDNSWKTVHLRCCNESALIGEFIFTDEVKAEIIHDACRYFEKICTGRRANLNLMEGRMLTVACVLLCQNNDTEAEDQDSGKLWQTILDGLQIKKVSQKTGCSEQTARSRLCTLLDDSDNIHFFTENGHRYYNTLQLHALSPIWSIHNLYDILYSFYRENLECCYDMGSNAAAMFTAGICRRWNQDAGSDILHLRSSQVSSGLRELFVLRPKYMAAVCDALLERIDHIVQGDFTILDDMNRWDVLLKEWYIKKSAYEKTQMKTERKAAVKRKIVDTIENIHPEYRFESGCLYLSLPGIRLPEIKEQPIFELCQNGKRVYKQKLSVFGNDMLLSTRPLDITLDVLAEINWQKSLCLSVNIISGSNVIYYSGTALFREYLCFSPAGNEATLTRCSQTIRLITGKNCNIEIHDSEENWIEDPAYCYRAIRLWMESVDSIKLDDREILQENGGKKKRIWAYMMPEPVGDINAQINGEIVVVYREDPVLHIAMPNKNDGKNYHLIIDGVAALLYVRPWEKGQFKVMLPLARNKVSVVQIKDFERGEIVFERRYITIPSYSIIFDRPYYPDEDCAGSIQIRTSRGVQKVAFKLTPGENSVAWDWKDIRFEAKAPRLRVELGGKNAFYLPKMIWYNDETISNSFLAVHAPQEVLCSVFFNGRLLKPNFMGHFEIGTEIAQRSQNLESAILGLVIRYGNEHKERLLTEVRFSEAFISDPVIQDGKEIIWRPKEACFVGVRDTAAFRLDLENSMQQDPFTYSLTMKDDFIEKNFDCKAGKYKYSLWLVGQRKMFTKLPDKQLLEGEIVIEDSPQERFQNKHIILTYVSYSDPVTQKTVCTKMRRDCAVIDYIRFEGYIDGDVKSPYYSGELFFRIAMGWQSFSDCETDRFEKLNPVYFSLQDGYILVFNDPDMTVDDQLMLNLKGRSQYENVQLFSQKDELTPWEQRKYLGFAEKFRYIEKEN